MRKVILIMGMLSILGGCAGDDSGDGTSDKTGAATADSVQNPFFTEWDGPFGTPPFDRIEISHYEPAMVRAMAQRFRDLEQQVRESGIRRDR